jgi:hypothetical protein
MAKEPKEMTVEQLLEIAMLNAQRFEEAVQRGEADASPDQIAQAKRERERARKLLKYRADVEFVLSDVRGRRVMWRVLELSGPNRISHTPGDSHHTAFLDGKRSVANDILLILFDADQGVYARMQREHLSDMKADQERAKQIQGEQSDG